MSMLDGAWLALIGLGAGLSGGLLGIGGSIVMIPAMTELLGAQQHQYQAASLIVNFFVAAPALVQHVRARATRAPVLKRLVPTATVAALTGVAFSELSIFRGDQAIYLTGLFGVFLLYVAACDVARWRRTRRYSPTPVPGPRAEPNDAVRSSQADRNQTTPARNGADPTDERITVPRIVFGVALPTGLVAGLLGIGGGVLAVPLQQRLLRIPLRAAIANSAATIVVLSLVGAVAKNCALAVDHSTGAWYEPARLACFLIPTAIIGSTIGGRSTHVLPLRAVRGARRVPRAVDRRRHRHDLPRGRRLSTAADTRPADFLRPVAQKLRSPPPFATRSLSTR